MKTNLTQHQMKPGGFLYRMREQCFAPMLDEFENPVGRGRMDLIIDEYRIDRVTPCGVWIAIPDYPVARLRFVNLTSRKRFAWATIDEATASFIARKQRQSKILSAQLENARTAISIAQSGIVKPTVLRAI